MIARGMKVFDHTPVFGRLRVFDGPDDVLELLDRSALGIIALVRDAGATFLSPLFDELTAIVCTGGTPRSHIGIVSREFQVPCVMGAVFIVGQPVDGAVVEVDCSGEEGIVRG